MFTPGSRVCAYRTASGRGKWLSRDPIGELGFQTMRGRKSRVRADANLYGFVRNNPLRYVDAFGLYLSSFPGGPDVFWDKWTQQQRDAWFKDFKNKLGPIIDQAANAHCVPKELLSTIIANEMIDYTRKEYNLERLGFGDSVGPAQITAGTVVNQLNAEELFPGALPPDGDSLFAPRIDETYIRQQLIDAKVNVDIASRLLKSYLEKLCSTASSGAMTSSFKNDVAPGCNLGDFCCRKGKSCKEMVNYNAPRCLIQALSAVWNNGPKLATDVNDIPNQSPNGFIHGQNAGYLDGVFDP